MSSKIPFVEQDIRDSSVVRKSLSGRGNGLVSTRDISPRGQVLFVRRPSLLALENKRLEDTCYHCFRSASDQNTFLLNPTQPVNLKACTGCKTVKFCDRTCLKLAWNRYHKHECKIYGKLHPRLLPTSTRAILRLLLHRKDGMLLDGEWEQILSLESHKDQISKSDSTKYFDLCLMAKATHVYSGTSESLNTVEKLCFILTVNSFTLTNPVFEPLGVILHPLPALINHSCTPNAYVRFDIPPPPNPPGATLTHPTRLSNSSISIHALSPIPKGTEITISYIDTSLPTPTRQNELSSQYFFICSCPLCKQGPNALTDALLPPPPPSTQLRPTIEETTSLASETLSTYTDRSSTSPPPLNQQISSINHVLSLLARTGRFPPHRHPYPQLRTQLMQLYISTSQYHLALKQACLKSYSIDLTLYPSKQHPIRIMGMWLIYLLSRHCLIQQFEDDPKLEDEWVTLPRGGAVKMLAGLMCLMLKELSDLILPEEYRKAGGPKTELGRKLLAKLTGLEGRKSTAARKTNEAWDNDNAKSTASSKDPPPYIGPETAPSGPDALPSYSESPKERSNDYSGSTHGAFESLIARALMETMTGDGAMFWREYEEGRLPDEGDVKMWVAGMIKEVMDSEREDVGEDKGNGMAGDEGRSLRGEAGVEEEVEEKEKEEGEEETEERRDLQAQTKELLKLGDHRELN